MSQVINTNVASLNAQRNLNISQNQLQTSLERLSSGLRINSAKDDAAGLAISEGFTSQIRGLNQAARNANDGISMIQAAEGALQEVGNNLQRLRELAVQGSTSTNSEELDKIGEEVAQLAEEIERIINVNDFNGLNILGDTDDASFQVGANNTADDQIDLDALNVNDGEVAAAIAINGFADTDEARDAIDTYEDAIGEIASARAELGAVQNRLESAVANVNTTAENLSAARSRILDADFATETANLTRTQILQQAGTSVLAQANQAPQNVLALLN